MVVTTVTRNSFLLVLVSLLAQIVTCEIVPLSLILDPDSTVVHYVKGKNSFLFLNCYRLVSNRSERKANPFDFKMLFSDASNGVTITITIPKQYFATQLQQHPKQQRQYTAQVTYQHQDTLIFPIWSSYQQIYLCLFMVTTTMISFLLWNLMMMNVVMISLGMMMA